MTFKTILRRYTLPMLALTVILATLLCSCSKNADGAEKTMYCTLSIDCKTILANKASLEPAKLSIVPDDGVILEPTEVEFVEGESVFDVLLRTMREQGIHMEFSQTPMYSSAYIEGIANIYEFDCGELSGWVYSVNGEFPNYGCSLYTVSEGDEVKWQYTCDLGRDVADGITLVQGAEE